jgi:hypothetical protein
VTLPESSIEWGGLTLYGTLAPGRLTFRTLEGWEGFDGRTNDMPRPAGHGSFDSPVWANARRVLASGRVGSPQERDAILAQLGASMTPDEGDLRITNGGRTLTARAHLLRYAPAALTWAAGWFDWAAEWVCADPLRYADPASLSTGFATAGGGLRFPLFTNGTAGVGYLDFGAPGTTGRVVLTNTGTAPASPQYAVLGPVADEGFDIVCVETGERITYAAGVSAGSTVVLDAATGQVVLNGDADKSGSLTRADWFTIPPNGVSRTVAFLNRGVASDAVLTATVRPPSW